jgi:PTH1 family peptidyl-tRNA hydrolase
MIMVVGLGNPGARYRGTRHNVGFATVDALAARHGVSLGSRAHRAAIGRGVVAGVRVLLAKPQTYMNLSGESVGALSRYHRIEPSGVWVVVDDVALPVGALRLRLAGSAGGHHGLESVEAHLGTRQYPRIRIGIGGASVRDLVDHVLTRFAADEAIAMEQTIGLAADAIELALTSGFETAMNRYNRSAQTAPDGEAEGEG